jgi:hypothetical protein
MQTNNHKITDYDVALDAKFGREGTLERDQALTFHYGHIALLHRSGALFLLFH